MRKMKYAIILLLFFVMIGYAAVSVSLSIKGSATVLSDLEDFKVYFSDVLVNGIQNLRLVNNDNELVFKSTLYEIGDTYEIEYDVTNGSSLFDASLSMSCTGGNSYLAVVNDFDTSDLEALGTRSGTLTLKKTKTNALEEDRHFTVTCTIVATPVGRDSVGSGSVAAPLQPFNLDVGDYISIGSENFNVIKVDGDNVTMLAQYNLGTNYRQSSTQNSVSFSSVGGWIASPGPKEVDIQSYAGSAQTYVNNYVSFLKTFTGSDDLSGNLISLAELGMIGCQYPADYSLSGTVSCASSQYGEWLLNGQNFWTRSTSPSYSAGIWSLTNTGGFSISGRTNVAGGIRPTITLPIGIARRYYVHIYSVGEEVYIGDEGFNVISDNGDTVTMLAQYNIGANYKQSETSYRVAFSYNTTWVYSPGPKEIDVQTYGSESKDLLNSYVTYLRGETGDTSLSGDLITLTQLKQLGCTISDTYAETGADTCANSEHISWINNKQNWWTRSAYPNSNGLVWLVSYDRFSLVAPQGTGSVSVGVRPIITISKKYM